jgi:Subtilase family/FHA domain
MEPGKRKVVGAVTLVLGVALAGGGGWFALHPSPTPTPPSAGPAFSTAPPIESLAKQYPSLESALNDPRLASVVQEFLGAYQKGGVEGAKAFAKERGLLTARDELAFTVLFEGSDTSLFEAELKTLDGRVTGRGDNQLDVAVPWASLEKKATEGQPPEQVIGRLSRITNVRGVMPLERASRPDQGRTNPRGPPTAAPAAPTSRVEGVSVTHANLWHAAGFRGRGIRVGVLDPEVSRAQAFLGRAYPTTVKVLMGECVSNGRPVDDEGTHGPAAAEIVSAMAPEAEIFIACSLGDRDASINWLVRQGVKIISHSAGGMYGPRNGQGAFQRQIDQLARQGILWVNAAGNSGTSFHRGQLTGGPDGYWHTFASGRQGVSFRSNPEGHVDVTMLWAQWEGSVSDYDLYLFDAQGRELARSSNRNEWLRKPQENISINVRPNTDYLLGVRGKGATRPTVFVLDVHGATRIELPEPTGSLNAPGDAIGSFTVGAAVWNGDTLAPYSSRGPTEDGRLKPDISAPTETTSLVYGDRFGGTSASTPHVAGAAAVVWSRYPNFSRDDVVRFLLSRAVDRGPAGPDPGFGVGRLDLGPPGETAAPPPPTQPVAVAPPTVPTAVPLPPPAPTRPPSARGDDDDTWSTIGSIFGALAITGLGGLLLIIGFFALLIDRLRGSGNRSARLAVPAGYSPAYGPPGPYGGPRPSPGGPYPPQQGPAYPQRQGQGSPQRQGQGGGPQGHGQGNGPQRQGNGPQRQGNGPQRQGGGPPGQGGGPPGQGGGPPGQGGGPQRQGGGPQRQGHAPPQGARAPTPTPPSLGAVLVGLEGPLAGKTISLKPQGETVFGRAPGSDVVLPLSTVSSKHAKINFAEGAYHISDERSANGTFVNGERVTKQPLCSGDEIAVGGARFRFERGG